MKIAIYHGFDKIHYEMLGYILEFCLKYKVDFTLYAKPYKDWLEYYNKIFNTVIDWIDPATFNESPYDYIFLVTDDDPSFPPLENPNKIICIDHMVNVIRRDPVYVHIATRYSLQEKNVIWALPLYKALQEKVSTTNEIITVTCIGFNSTPKSSQQLQELFTNFDKIEFHIVNHYIYYRYDDDVSNIIEHIDVDVNVMTDLLRKSEYVLCLENNKTKDYENKVMSAAIPLAFDFGCKLIMPHSWKEAYQLQSPIGYSSSTPIHLEKSVDFQQVFEERDRLLAYRDAVFKGVLRL